MILSNMCSCRFRTCYIKISYCGGSWKIMCNHVKKKCLSWKTKWKGEESTLVQYTVLTLYVLERKQDRSTSWLDVWIQMDMLERVGNSRRNLGSADLSQICKKRGIMKMTFYYYRRHTCYPKTGSEEFNALLCCFCHDESLWSSGDPIWWPGEGQGWE